MSSRYIFVTCPECSKTEMVYIGDIDVVYFDLDSETMTVVCNECKESDNEDEGTATKKERLHSLLTDDTIEALVRVAEADDPEPIRMVWVRRADWPNIPDGDLPDALVESPVWTAWKHRQDLRAALPSLCDSPTKED